MHLFAAKSYSLYPNSNKMDPYLLGYMLFFTIISAIRWGVGADCNNYIEIFQNGTVRDNSEEFLWDWLVKVIHNYGLHFSVGMAVTSFLQIFFICKSFQRYKIILIWLPFVLFGGRYYLDLMNGVRQMITVCGFIFLSKYIVEKKPLLFLLGIILLSGFHHSVLLLIPIYLLTFVPFDKIKLYDKRTICLIIFALCVVAGQTTSFNWLLKFVEPIASFIGYDNHVGYYSEVLQGSNVETLSFGPTMISFLLSSCAVIWFGPSLYKTYGNEIPYFDLWYFFAFFYSCTYFLFCNVSHMMIRPFKYFEFFLVAMLALLLHLFYSKGGKYKYYFYALMFVIWVCTIIGVYKASGTMYEFTIYKMFFGRV